MYNHYKNGYYISSTGKIKRIRYNKNNKSKECKVDLYTSNAGYYYFVMYNDNNKKIWLHRCVAELFLPKISGKHIVDHIDGDRKNNNLKNLRWVTFHENLLNNPRSRKSNK